MTTTELDKTDYGVIYQALNKLYRSEVTGTFLKTRIPPLREKIEKILEKELKS
ncbi:MAG: hypothetical protein AB3N18_13090 [Allomuricauda sp.]